MQRVVVLILTMLGALYLSGCSPVRVPPVSTYSLVSLSNSKALKHFRTQLTLGVGVPTASPGFDTSNMVYMMTPYQLSQFALHRWVAPPAQMLLPIVVQALRDKGYFKAVVATPYSAKTNYRLDFQLLQLQQNFMNPTSMEQVSIQVNIYNNDTNRIVASRRFSAAVAAKENTPYSGVLAANRAVANLSKQVANFAVRAVR